ncbi:TPA: helix-turn-helix domain-containing protein [Streptococcus suis]|nr:helix-turn-helix domain-containing protein [Streptococcus suis]
MNNFGKVFKKFRQARGLKLKEIAKFGLSTSQLSRFEHGETDLTLSKFMIALDGINMPIDEFMYAARDFHRDELNELLEQIRDCVTTRNIDGLKRLLIMQMEKNNCGKFQQINTILVKIRLQDLSGENYYSNKDLNYLTDYLFSVEYWGNYELLIFINTLDVLNHDTFMILSREMARRSDFYREIPTNRRLISTMLLNGFIACIERKKMIDALYFEKQLQHCFFIETEIFERLVFHYARNLYLYQKTGTQSAIIEMRKCIGAMKLAGSDQLAKTYENYLNKLLNQSK